MENQVQPVPRWLWKLLISITLVLLIIGTIGLAKEYVFRKKTPKTENTTTIVKPLPGSRILRFEDHTPCSHVIDYAFEIETDGDPVWLKFPGINDPALYSGKGRFEFSNCTERTIGEKTTITSANGQNVRVRVYEKY